jgi:hypothetical protein
MAEDNKETEDAIILAARKNIELANSIKKQAKEDEAKNKTLSENAPASVKNSKAAQEMIESGAKWALDKNLGDVDPKYWGAILGGYLGYKSSGATLNPFSQETKQAFTPQSNVTTGQPNGSLTSTDAQHERQIQGRTNPDGNTGRANQTTYQFETERRAEQAAQADKVANQLRASGVILDEHGNPIVRSPGMTSTPTGVLHPTTTAQAISSDALQTAQRAAQREALINKVLAPLTYAKDFIGTPAVQGTLKGAGIVGGLVDTGVRAFRGDPVGATISGLTTALSAAYPEVAIPTGLAIQYMHDNPQFTNNITSNLEKMASGNKPAPKLSQFQANPMADY